MAGMAGRARVEPRWQMEAEGDSAVLTGTIQPRKVAAGVPARHGEVRLGGRRRVGRCAYREPERSLRPPGRRPPPKSDSMKGILSERLARTLAVSKSKGVDNRLRPLALPARD